MKHNLPLASGTLEAEICGGFIVFVKDTLCSVTYGIVVTLLICSFGQTHSHNLCAFGFGGPKAAIVQSVSKLKKNVFFIKNMLNITRISASVLYFRHMIWRVLQMTEHSF